jgi:hypothetical protein
MAMTRGTRLALTFAVALFLLAAAGIALAGSAVRHASGGPVRIEVHEQGGEDFSIAVPGFVVGLALSIAPDEALAEPLDEARPWLAVARAAVEELGQAGDFTLVSVVKRDERVTIRTERGVLVGDVDDHGDRVRIEMPLQTVDRVVRRLDRAAARTAERSARAVAAPEAPAAGATM